MNRVKTDFCNQLSTEQLENCVRISEEGCDIASCNPDNAIKKCCEGKVHKISSGKLHKYPNKLQQTESATIDDIIDIARYVLDILIDCMIFLSLFCYKEVYVNSFFPCTARLWNSLPI